MPSIIRLGSHSNNALSHLPGLTCLTQPRTHVFMFSPHSLVPYLSIGQCCLLRLHVRSRERMRTKCVERGVLLFL